MKYYLGVDIGGTSVKIAVVSSEGEIINSTSYSVSYDNYKTPILDSTVDAVKQYLKDVNYELEGIGVSATGQIDTNKGEVIGTAGNLPNYVGSKIKERFIKEFNLHTTVQNDANCMILGEKWIGNHDEHKNIVGITIGTGVGGGIIVDDNILLGLKGIAGEVGHFTIKKDGKPCMCGNIGCYEQYASTTALLNKANEFYNVNLNGKDFFEKAHNNDQKALEILDEWIDDIAVGLVTLTHIFNPSLILIGGGVSLQQELLIDPLEKRIRSKIMPRFNDDLTIKACTLKNDAGLVGAVYFHISKS